MKFQAVFKGDFAQNNSLDVVREGQIYIYIYLGISNKITPQV